MDEWFFILIGLGFVLAFPALAVAGFWRSGDARRRVIELETQVTRLALDLDALKRQRGPLPDPVAAFARAGGPAEATAAKGTEADAPDEAAPARSAAMADPADSGDDIAFDNDDDAAAAEAGPSEAAARGRGSVPPISEAARSAEAPGADDDAAPARTGGLQSLEREIGTRWVVWVGGVALALGGVFIVRFSIEQGWFGPLGRLMLGALVAAGLIGAGEWFRRREPEAETGPGNRAYIPGILTAAGTVAAFATVYAAYALYDIIGAGLAFIALGAVAAATMLAAVLHGPMLAALGLIGAHGVPFLVSTSNPSIPGFVGYELVITAAAMALARVRDWRWISQAALGLAIAVAVLIVLSGAWSSASVAAFAVSAHGLGLIGLALALRAHGRLAHDPLADVDGATGLRDRALVLALGLLALLAVVRLSIDAESALAGVSVIATLALMMAAAMRWPALAPLSVVAGVCAGLGLAAWNPSLPWAAQLDTFGEAANPALALRPAAIGGFLALALGCGVAMLAAGAFGALRAATRAPRAAAWVLAGGASGALFVILAAWGRVDAFETSWMFAVAALALAFALAVLTETLVGREAGPANGETGLASAVAAALALTALGATLGIGLEGEALTLGLAALVAGIAWLSTVRPWPILRRIAEAAGLVLLVRVLWVGFVDPAPIGSTPIFNALLVVYLAPAVGCALAAWLLVARGRDRASDLLEALAVAFLALFAVFEIRHLVHGGDIWRVSATFVEFGLQATVGLVLAGVLGRLASRSGSTVLRAGAVIVRVVTLLVAGPGLLIGVNPLWTLDAVAGFWPLDTLLLGYALPAAAATLATWDSVRRRAAAASAPAGGLAGLSQALASPRVFGTLALVLAMAYAGLTVRFWSVGPILSVSGVGSGELWAYSAILIGFGLLTLLIGWWAPSLTARMGSFALVACGVLKVFLVDMGNLTGLAQGLSLIGLGLTLVGIGVLYQKLIFRRT